MAGPGKFVLIEYDKSLQSEGGWDYYGMKKEIQGFYTKDWLES